MLIERCAGIDIGKDEVVACVRTSAPSGRGRHKQTRTFSSFTGALQEMADWFTAEGVTAIVMEATAPYWKLLSSDGLSHSGTVTVGAECARLHGMAITACRECGSDVSTEAPVCPRCGIPRPGIETITNHVLREEVARLEARGFSLEQSDGNHVIMVSHRKVNHVVHGILSVLTLGIWLVVWLIIAVGSNKPTRVGLVVDTRGELTRHLLT